MMSEAKALLVYFGSLIIVCGMLLAAYVLSAYLLHIFLGLGVLVFLTLLGIGWRKWQHSRLPVNEDRREHRRLLLEEAERRERLRLERERHEHELQLERARHEHELDLQLQAYALQQQLALTRAGYDANGNPPIFLHADGRYTLLPPANPPYRPLQAQLRAPDEQRPAGNQGEPALPPPIDAYDLLRSGQWTPSPQMLLLAVGAGGALIQVAITLAWHIALAGSTGNGKTNQLRLLLAQLVKCYEVYYISPAFAPIKANHEDWRQIEARLAGPVACDAVNIRARLQWAVELYQYRQEQERAGDFTWQQKPIYLVIDEYIAVCKRYPGAAEDVSELLRFARQYQVFVIVASQDFLIKNIGGDSGARDCYRTALYFGGDPTTARALLDISGTLPYEQDLGKEGLLVLRTRSTQVSQARAPFMSNRAIYELLGWPTAPILDERPVTQAQAGPGGTQWHTPGAQVMEPLAWRTPGPQMLGPTRRFWPASTPTTGDLPQIVDALAEPSGPGPTWAPAGPAEEDPARGSEEKQFTPEQELRFLRLYRANPNIRECLRAMQLGNRYFASASRLVVARKLRKA